MKKVLIIGGGSSGLISSIFAKKGNNDVTVIDSNNSCGKKLLLTGNGKCNYFNSDNDLRHYNTSSGILSDIITSNNLEEVLKFFSNIGIVPFIKNGYYYPYSNLSCSILYALLNEAKNLGVNFINDYKVSSIKHLNNKFIVGNKEYDKVIIATGSKALERTGSDGSGFDLAKLFNHSIVPVLPALTALKSDATYLKKWAGIRVNASVSLFIDDEFIKEEEGEVQLTDYGVSGICIFNLSSKASRALYNNKSVLLKINFVNWYDGNDFNAYLSNRNSIMKDRTIVGLCEGFLNYKIINIILKELNIKEDAKFDELNESKKNSFIKMLTSFDLKINGTNNFDNAQVCTGGVRLDEINHQTFESLKQKGLYLIGEVLDVDADCGGYNLTFAWISGILAGKDASND